MSGSSGNRQDSVDRNLLQKITHGDREAFEALYHHYRRALGPFIFRILRDRLLGEEVFNDVMFAVWDRPQAFNGTSKVSTWIFSIAYRKCLYSLRQRPTATSGEAVEGSHSEFASFERKDLIRRALEHLSPEQRLVIEMSYFSGANYEEIATVAGCPVNTIKTRMYHARRRLRTIVEEFEAKRVSAGGDS